MRVEWVGQEVKLAGEGGEVAGEGGSSSNVMCWILFSSSLPPPSFPLCLRTNLWLSSLHAPNPQVFSLGRWGGGNQVAFSFPSNCAMQNKHHKQPTPGGLMVHTPPQQWLLCKRHKALHCTAGRKQPRCGGQRRGPSSNDLCWVAGGREKQEGSRIRGRAEQGGDPAWEEAGMVAVTEFCHFLLYPYLHTSKKKKNYHSSKL